MATRTWTNGSGLALSAANLNSLETDLAAKADKTVATSSVDGLMPKADKSKLDAATGSPTGSTLAMRYTDGRLGVSTPTGGTDAANKSYVDSRPTADLLANDGKQYGFVGGVIRNDGGPAYWQLIGSGHSAVNITSVETWSDKIRVYYDDVDFGFSEIVTFIAAPDESLARQGFSCGTSVTSWYTDIYLYQTAKVVSDYVSYNGTTWVSQNGVFTGMTFSGGILTLTHEAIPTAAVYNVNLTPRGGGYVYAVGRGSSPTTETTLKVDIRDMSGTSVTTPNTDLTFYVSRGGGITQATPSQVDTIAIPYSNIWFYGVMGIGF